MRKLFFLTISTVTLGWLGVDKALAQTDAWGINNLSDLNVGTRTIGDTVAGIINIALGFLGVIAVALIIYGGFLWMTSNGNSDKIQKAKLLIISALIGLAIITSAFIIARFVLNALGEATGGPSGGGSSGPGVPGVCPPPGDGITVVVCNPAPDAGTIGSYFTTYAWNIGAHQPGISRVEFTGPDTGDADLATCSGSPSWVFRGTAGPDNYYQIIAIVPDLALSAGYTVNLYNGGGAEPSLGTFDILSGAPYPGIACIVPDSYPPSGVTGNPADLITIQGVGFGPAPEEILMHAWSGGIEDTAFIVPLANIDSWGEDEITFYTPIEALTGPIRVHVGTNTSNPYQFTVECSADGQCESSCCPGAPTNGACYPYAVCNLATGGPVITGINPDNAAANDQNLITIHGSGFGAYVAGLSQVNFAGGVLGTEPSTISPQCSGFWNDNYILILVPPGASTGNVTVTTGGGQNSNPYPFTVNGVTRPGLCAVTEDLAGLIPKPQGYFGDTAYLWGLGLQTTMGDTYFGDFISPVSNAAGIAEIETEVPNVLGALGITYRNGETSNPYPFTVLPGTSGAPLINEIFRDSGPAGQYITISGANFGPVPGDVVFNNGTDYSADFNFPAQCRNNVWRHDSIIAKVPDAGGATGAFQVRVERADSQYSNNYLFTKTAGLPGPGLCALVPTNGPEAMNISAFGDNFGLAPGVNGDVEFYNGVSTAGTWAAWNNTQVLNLPVPAGAQSGPVVVYNDVDPLPSNPITFNIGSCSANIDCTPLGYTTCCTDSFGANYCADTCGPVKNECHYGWTFTTESALSIIDRGPICDNACLNGLIWVDFDAEIAGGFVNDGNFSIYSCGADSACATPDTSNNLVDNTMDASYQAGPFVHPSTGQNYWTVEIPHNPLTVDEYYIVEVDQNIENTLGATMGPDPLASWTFGVGLNNCYIDHVAINPVAPVAFLGTSIPYRSVAYSAPGICYPTGMPLACIADANPSFDCSWSWASDNAPIASIPNIDDPMNTASANDVGTANIRSTANQGAGHVSPPSNVTVISGPMRLTGYAPNCGAACTNALTYVDFNNQLAPAFFDPVFLQVNRCLNPDCSLYAANEIGSGSYVPPALPGDPHRYYLTAGGGAPIPYIPFAEYRFFVSPAVQDIYGTTIVNGLETTFGVGDAPCLIETVDLAPASASVYIGDTAQFHANGRSGPDACSATGQQLSCVANANPTYDCAWSWDSSAGAIASIPSINAPSNTATALSVGTTFINAHANQGGFAFTDSSNITVNTRANPGVYNPQPLGPGACPNGMVSASFTELMERTSVFDNFKLYQESPVDISGMTCVFNGSWWCELPLDNIVFENDTFLEDTTASLRLAGFMATSTTHRAMIYGGPSGVLSTYGMDLDATAINYDIDGGGPDGFSWAFDTGAELCAISHTVLEPAADTFTCSATSGCWGDISGASGNQHAYTAHTYDIRGEELVVDQHDWSIQEGLITGVPAVTTVSNQIEGTATNQNGTEILTVTVSDSDPAVLGTANSNARIDLFICENPWPSYSSFPWTPSSNSYNYSTFYCQDSGVEGAEILPYINPATGPTNPTPDGVLPQGEHIFLIYSPISAAGSNLADAAFGTLAYKNNSNKNDNLVDEDKWYHEIARDVFGIPKADAGAIILACTPMSPANMHIASYDDTHIELDWQRPATGPVPTYYRLQRRIVGETLWGNLANGIVPTDYDDTTVVAGVEYEYRGWSFYAGTSGLPPCPEVTGYWSPSASGAISQMATAEEPSWDLIGIRVMNNIYHLSVSDWYQQFAPNPEVAGTLMQVDGYEALQVGNTTYIAATNVRAGGVNQLWTNVYIIAHNIGASPNTIQIYNEMIENMKLNVNVDQQNNTCSLTVDTMCSSDFDCPIGEECNSRGLKLRRDTRRLADLIHVSDAIEAYGQSHKACDTAPERSCYSDSDCASVGGSCIPLYPILESGSFVNGLSTSNWPESWGTNFPNLLSVDALPEDPIGLFNGCPDDTMPGGPADPNTCWNEVDQIFTCPLDSLVYFYDDAPSDGRNYFIGANFEYDDSPYGAVTFRNFLINTTTFAGTGVINIPHVDSTLDLKCNATTYSPGPVTTPLCGNGLPDGLEECDGNFRELCDATVGAGNWWNERLGGCHIPGTPDECTWYTPNPALTAADCGGYCGNANIDVPYESCDGAAFDGLYTCYYPDTATFEVPNCDANLCQPLCPTSGMLAAPCGDGYWDPTKEQCDASGMPDGLAGWDCSGGSAYCNNCQISCTVGVLYGGECGDGVVDAYCDNDPSVNCADDPTICLPGGNCVFYETCEPSSWVVPDPENATDINHQYLCNPVTCQTFAGFCGDSMPPYPAAGPPSGFYQPELCDWDSYPIPSPIQSDSGWQYICSDGTDTDPETGAVIGACDIGGGWCGDGYTFDSNGNSQLLLDMNCGLPESCDDFDNVDTNVCTNNCQWTCYIREDVSFPACSGAIDDDPIQDMLIGASTLDVSEGLLFDNAPTIDLYSGDSTFLNLRKCRASGPVAVDVTIENNESYAGIVFVSDLSGSMAGANVAALRTAIAGTGNALDTILDRNPGAMVALVTYDGAINPQGLDTGFLNIADNIDFLKAKVNAYSDNGSTNHEVGLARARQLLAAESFENSIVIFMTDGGSASSPPIAQAELLKYDPVVGVMGKIFTVAMTTNTGLRGFLNSISSATDYCTYTGTGTGTAGQCGGIDHQNQNCHSVSSVATSRHTYEQCDPEVDADCYAPGAMDGGEYVECRWTPASLETNYFYYGADVTGMYNEISGSIPVNTVELQLSYLTGGPSPPTSVISNGTYYIDTRGGGVDCTDPYAPDDNVFELEASFSGNPAAFLRLSNPRYSFCSWDNCAWCD